MWYNNDQVKSALEEARLRDKALLIDLWHPTCLGCAKLFATTYQDESVRAFLRASFVVIKYNTTKPNAWFKRLNGRVAHVFHPHLVIADSRLTESRRFVGYLPPEPFKAQLQLGLGILHLHYRRFEQALTAFEQVSRAETLPSAVVAEALYWRGIAAYRVTQSFDKLAQSWCETAVHASATDWAMRADCLDVSIPSLGFDAENLELIKMVQSAR